MSPDDIQTTIRAYSSKVGHRLPAGNEAHDLGQALVQQMNSEMPVPSKQALIRSFFEKDASDDARDPLTELIRDESDLLVKKLLEFDQRIPKKDMLKDNQFDPTMEGVVKVIQQVVSRWEEKKKEGFVGKAKVLFRRVCRGIDSHSSMLKLLPEGNEYVSLFTGALSIIITASANYEEVAEGFAENLCSINESVKDIQVDKSLYDTDDMVKAVSEFYSHIFLYLSSVMDWIMKKGFIRLMKSLNEKLTERFENDIKRIGSSADRIRNLAQQSSRAELRFHREESESAYRDMRLGLRGVERQNAEMMHQLDVINRRQAQIEEDQQQEALYQRQLGFNVKLFLEERTRHEQSTHYSLKIVSPDQFELLAQSGLPLKKLDQVTELTSSDEVALGSRHVEDFFSRDRVRLHTNPYFPMPFEPEVISRITDWSRGQAVPMLRIDGPALSCEDGRNPLTMLAAQLVNLTASSRLHVVSYFCELSRAVDTAERRAQATVALVYSLTRQLVELLPPEFEVSADLSEARFRQLDGTLGSCGEAMSIFQDLLDVVPATTVYCIIDGLHLMDDGRVEEPLRLFLRQLRGGKVRALFTTSGRSAWLSKELKIEESLVIDSFHKGVAAHGLSI